MITFDDVTKENIKEHNSNWPQIQKGSLFNIISHQLDIGKIYIYMLNIHSKISIAKAKYQLLIKKEKVQASRI